MSPTRAQRVALLRGINVGTAKRVAMADLRRLLEGLGYEGVRTLLNSGNVVFTSSRRHALHDARAIEHAIALKLGVTTRVTVLDAHEVAEAVHNNPLGSIADKPSRLLLMVLQDETVGTKLRPLLEARWAPEALALRKRVAYLWCADGIGASRLWAAANRALDDSGTARNLDTMTKLMGLVKGT